MNILRFTLHLNIHTFIIKNQAQLCIASNHFHSVQLTYLNCIACIVGTADGNCVLRRSLCLLDSSFPINIFIE